MFIQYKVPGFELMTFERRVSSNNHYVYQDLFL